MQPLSTRATSFHESVIRRMTRIANRHHAINLAQGFPEFDPPKAITDRLKEVSDRGPHQYAVTWGASNFRTALAQKQSQRMKIPIDPDENIVVTCGGTEAMMAAVMSVCNPGDKVIIFSPFYENYTADAILSGVTPIYVKLHPPAFTFEEEELRKAFEQHPKALILCNPSNPSGRVFTKKELQTVAALVEEFDAYVITDEVYEHIVYPPHQHRYFASLPNMKDRTISTGSLSKTYSITGWRLGYIIAKKEIIDACKTVHDFLTVGAAAPLQEAATVGLQFPDTYYEDLLKKYTHMKNIFCEGLTDIGLSFFEPEGTYFVMVDMEEFGCRKDTLFAEQLTEKIGVACVPGSSFFHDDTNRYVRFHFAKNDDTLHESIRRLKKIRTVHFET